MPNRLSSWKHWGTVSRLAIIVGTGLVITLPCLIYGFPFYGDDSASNLVLCRQFAAQFCSGELYPRWLQGLNGGLGNPTGFYYPPFSYWFTSLLKSLSGSDPISWRQLGVSAVFAVVASGVFAFFWLRRTVSSNVALLAAVVYLILPYHVHTDLYGRGALAELWSFAWMPLILWAVDEKIGRAHV